MREIDNAVSGFLENNEANTKTIWAASRFAGQVTWIPYMEKKDKNKFNMNFDWEKKVKPIQEEVQKSGVELANKWRKSINVKADNSINDRPIRGGRKQT